MIRIPVEKVQIKKRFNANNRFHLDSNLKDWCEQFNFLDNFDILAKNKYFSMVTAGGINQIDSKKQKSICLSPPSLSYFLFCFFNKQF